MKEERNRYDRHSEFIPESQQDRLHRSRILLAGCGAGSPIAAYLARLGFGTKGKITLADPDQVGWENLSRQDYTENDIGLNKALALGNRINGINRQVQVNCIREGITDRNVRALVKQSDVVIDMIDIGAPKYSFLLHDVARESRRPVVLGLDIGEAAILAYVFDYRNPKAMSMRRLLGIGDNLRIEELEKIPMLGFVGQYLLGPCVRIFDDSHEAYDYYFRLVSDGGECILNCLSEDMQKPASKLLQGQLDYVPQTGLSAGLLGVMLTQIAKKIILKEYLPLAPKQIKLDINDLLKG